MGGAAAEFGGKADYIGLMDMNSVCGGKVVGNNNDIRVDFFQAPRMRAGKITLYTLADLCNIAFSFLEILVVQIIEGL